ncbi:Ypt/Rab-GAP domain of gyp1p superfamily protein [Rhynchospora pubera]|uniref:Ypt/Rab-GAP domain of gyp1p superfamily protein n=1 Tax=Rhynchospora pubera TaxID=906938 RepID=A0AAV8E7Z0_9POAL|nr:Ypt/Rab-GAP domain of gyp1p superfamily protein [Rhynchospora pubera]KAJ4777366.1 Ypt/Rab-GAP domain of gyp1p superfamily protein [Rhynchospora pubera]KAJ4784159.1 Ypt/Rab-GAP domain of gyp1p superfamily protein [Rhynchospora pubera]KAJ4803511.1 Ypt/Rab-GAP domain of gyp1p superfamily protein [Rhynchospora pubera]
MVEPGSTLAGRSMWAWGQLLAQVGGHGWIWGPNGGGRWHTGIAVGVTAIAGIALAATILISAQRGGLKSPWSGRKKKNPLTKQEWQSFFTPEGKLAEGGTRFLKKARSSGVHMEIRAEVWPFLLGVYDLQSSEDDRNDVRKTNRGDFLLLRKKCLEASVFKIKEEEVSEVPQIENEPNPVSAEGEEPITSEDIPTTTSSLSSEITNLDPVPSELPIDSNASVSNNSNQEMLDRKPSLGLPDTNNEDKSDLTHADSSDSESSIDQAPKSVESELNNTAAKEEAARSRKTDEDFATWQRIIRLDALRANAEWVPFSPTQAAVSKETAVQLADTVGLQDYDHLEPYRIYHASRLVSILEAYAMYDPEIGYCQGMSDLLAPIITVIEEDYEAFWCFVGFMKKARHNFRLDEVGIRRQLNLVAKIIKCKDQRLFRHLEKLQAEDCFFVYRMVVVMFRRELTFEQTVSLWEVMWADQAARRAGLGGSAWGPIKLDAPPTDDLLLYAIAASVLQKRKVILESYSSMDEIIRECNSMAGQLNVWKLLDDAHDLVVTLHDRIE